ncbi:MAG: hypothetical protein ACLFSC_12000 [Wenzhouxiangella sp.]
MNPVVDIETAPAAASGLLRLLQESGEQQCREILRAGNDKVAEVRRKAFARARERVRAAVADERKRMEQAIGRVEAELETTLRRRQLVHDARLVAEGRSLLEQALVECWRQPAARKAWGAALLDAAAAVAIARDWRIECPPDWPQEERDEIIRRASEVCGAQVEIQARDSITAGLKLVSGGLAVDMRIDGLLADRDRIDSSLLALYGRLREGARP